MTNGGIIVMSDVLPSSYKLVCEGCGKVFYRPGYRHRDSIKRNPNNGVYCSRGCVTLYSRAKQSRIKPEDTEARFLARVNKTDTCWLWTGAKEPRGYGFLYSGKHENGYSDKIAAHRLSYELYKGVIPDDLLIRHLCNNPSCVNPEHLEIGTVQDNSDDMKKSGRSLTGEKNHQAKATKEQALRAKELIDEGKLNYYEIGDVVGMSRESVAFIAQGRTWQHLFGLPNDREPGKRKRKLLERISVEDLTKLKELFSVERGYREVQDLADQLKLDRKLTWNLYRTTHWRDYV